MQQPNIVARYGFAKGPWPGGHLKYVSFDSEGKCFYENVDGSISLDISNEGNQYWTVAMANENVKEGIWREVLESE